MKVKSSASVNQLEAAFTTGYGSEYAPFSVCGLQ